MANRGRSMRASPEDDVMSCPNSMTGEGNHKTVARAKKAEQQDVLMRQG